MAARDIGPAGSRVKLANLSNPFKAPVFVLEEAMTDREGSRNVSC
jgi:hypothetical protein